MYSSLCIKMDCYHLYMQPFRVYTIHGSNFSFMKVTTGSVFDILTRLRAYFQRGNALRQYASEMPFRSELYNSDQLDRHGKIVASSHKLLNKPSSDQLIKRLDSNETTLLEVRNLLVESIRSGKNITPGAEWLLDNFYLITAAINFMILHV